MPSSGSVLRERYRIERRLGAGGMGSVYLATDLSLARPVAVKELAVDVREAQRHQAFVRQFTLEATLLRHLSHPRLPAVTDCFEAAGLYYLVMEYVEGQNLSRVLQERGQLPEQQVLQVGLQLCEILAYLHGQSPPVIFRDLKPSNVMLGADGVKLVDFGIAKVLDVQTGQGTVSVVHDCGSSGYAAPEQYGGASDARTDIYALGATLYTLLTGDVLPHSVTLCANVIRILPLQERLPGLQVETCKVLEHMLQGRPVDRPQTVDEVAERLSFALQTASTETVTPAHPETWSWVVSTTELAALTAQLESATATHPMPNDLPARTRPLTRWLATAGVVVVGAGLVLFRPVPPTPLVMLSPTPAVRPSPTPVVLSSPPPQESPQLPPPKPSRTVPAPTPDRTASPAPLYTPVRPVRWYPAVNRLVSHKPHHPPKKIHHAANVVQIPHVPMPDHIDVVPIPPPTR